MSLEFKTGGVNHYKIHKYTYIKILRPRRRLCLSGGVQFCVATVRVVVCVFFIAAGEGVFFLQYIYIYAYLYLIAVAPWQLGLFCSQECRLRIDKTTLPQGRLSKSLHVWSFELLEFGWSCGPPHGNNNCSKTGGRTNWGVNGGYRLQQELIFWARLSIERSPVLGLKYRSFRE